MRKADGQTFSPVLELINSDPRIPGITITGRFPVFVRAVAKMCSRFGVRRAEIQLDDTNENIINRAAKEDFDLAVVVTKRGACKIELDLPGVSDWKNLVNWWFPTSINQAGNESSPEPIIYVYHADIRSAGIQHPEKGG